MEDVDSKEDNFIPNPKELDGVPDLSHLVYLDMKNVLYNLHYRYSFMKSKHCYTSISTILVAINPYEKLPIYGQDVITEFDDAAKKGRLLRGRPHPYGVSARGYMRMIQRKCNQSIIVCGESGAGKTETTKLLMRYLAMTAPSTSMQASIVEQQIIAASPILEAYGNAKTVMNNNSSRFGKFTKLLYDVKAGGKNGYILGSYLETYLLEKSRVVFQSPNERNYHIFYFLQNGMQRSKDVSASLFVGSHSCDDYWYTNQGKTSTVPSISDKDRFTELAESLELMRIGSEAQPDLWRLTCAILNLGNVEFRKLDDGFAAIDMKKSKPYVAAVAELWGIKEEALVKRLTTANVKVVNNVIEKKITFSDAASNRDSIAKGIYEKVFLWLVQRINAELYQTDTDEEDNGNGGNIADILFIGILDVFGFENFYNNSLEQFCINFTNEKLQQYFNFHIIRSEQEEYIKESVFWKPLSIPDNLSHVNFVEDSKSGFFTILDSSCKTAKPDPVQFMQELIKHHSKNETFHTANKPGAGRWRGSAGKGKKAGGKGKGRRGGAKFSGFTINHFADDVTYEASSFIVKNMEAVHPDTAKMFNKSNFQLAKQIGGSKAKGGKRARRRLTVTGTFFRGIKTLMRNLKATEPFFVRCVNPNIAKSNEIWTESVVEHQLRCGGLLEALKVLKLGYPTRVPYGTLYERYHGSVTNPLIKNMGPEEFSTVLLIAFDVSEDDYELGLTKIFFKPSKAAVLDTIMAQAGKPLSPEQNKKITKWIVNKRVKQIMGTTKAFLEMRKRIRLVRAQQRWEWSGRVSAILGGTVVRHLGMAREKILKRKRQDGALALQTLFRGNYEHIRRIAMQKLNAKKMAEAKEAERVRLENEKNLQDKQEKQDLLDLAEEEEERKTAKKIADELELEKIKNIQTKAALKIQEDGIKQERTLRIHAKKTRENIIKLSMKNTAADEQRRIDEQEKAIVDKNFPERSDIDIDEPKLVTKRSKSQNSEHKTAGASTPSPGSEGSVTDSISDVDEEYDMEKAVAAQLKYFLRTAQIGHLFLRYSGGRRRRKPQDRIVKVAFDSDREPIQISWGSGTRFIEFKEIRYISHGHWTPVFAARKDSLDERSCFSVVGERHILDLQAHSEETALLWVRGLRVLLGQSKETAEALSKKGLESGNLPKLGKPRSPDTPCTGRDIVKLQQDLFIMTTVTVFRDLQQEGKYEIDQSLREKFDARKMYEQVLKMDVPWRNWKHWVRSRIVSYLEQQLQERRQSQMGSFGGYGYGYGAQAQPVPYQANYQPQYAPQYQAAQPVYQQYPPQFNPNQYPNQFPNEHQYQAPQNPQMQNAHQPQMYSQGMSQSCHMSNGNGQYGYGGHVSQASMQSNVSQYGPNMLGAMASYPSNNGNNGMGTHPVNQGKQIKTEKNGTADKDCALM